ncbi:MAG: PepSY domain-containing protein [Roseburia sp.]|nr:PepSY domain-containing protein [Roseburia sp.]MCM1242772.1 PepSY domain-containing protein [Roseburia sp.]
MKKLNKYGIYALGLSALLGLTGCGGHAPENIQEMPQTTDTEQTDTPAGVQETPDGGQENEAGNNTANTAENGQDAAESPQAALSGNKNAVYSQDDLYMSVAIPTDWDCHIKTKEEFEKEDGMRLCEITFWPENNADTVFELSYETSFGICGTGVTIEEFTLSNGLSGYRYTEEIEDTLWLTITLQNPYIDMSGGTYLISASPELSVWESIQPQFEEILQSIWVGSFPGGQSAAGAAETPMGGQTAGETGSVTSSQRPNAAVTEYITLEEAKSVALDNAWLVAADVTFLKEKLDYDDGVAEYEIEFVTDTTKYEYEINAKDGSVLSMSKEEIDRTNVIQVQDGITIEEAKQIALDHAGFSAGEVKFSKAETDFDDGIVEYEIEFYVGQKEYSYTIDAAAGTILETEIDVD